MRIAVLLVLISAAVMFLVLNRPMARRNVAAQNAYWGTHWGERAVTVSRVSTVVVTVIMIGFGIVMLVQ